MTVLTTLQKERLDSVVRELWERGYIGREIEVSTGYGSTTIWKSMQRQGLKAHKDRHNKYRNTYKMAPPYKLWGEPIREYIDNGSKVSVYHHAYADGYRGARL